MSYSLLLPNIGNDLAEEIDDELHRATVHGLKFANLHEGYSVILEELDEVWDITKLKKCKRDPVALKKELIQVAAMAIKAIKSMENLTGGDV